MRWLDLSSSYSVDGLNSFKEWWVFGNRQTKSRLQLWKMFLLLWVPCSLLKSLHCIICSFLINNPLKIKFIKVPYGLLLARLFLLHLPVRRLHYVSLGSLINPNWFRFILGTCLKPKYYGPWRPPLESHFLAGCWSWRLGSRLGSKFQSSSQSSSSTPHKSEWHRGCSTRPGVLVVSLELQWCWQSICFPACRPCWFLASITLASSSLFAAPRFMLAFLSICISKVWILFFIEFSASTKARINCSTETTSL